MSKHRSEERRKIAWGQALAQALGLCFLVLSFGLVAAAFLVLLAVPVLELFLVLIVAAGQAVE